MGIRSSSNIRIVKTSGERPLAQGISPAALLRLSLSIPSARIRRDNFFFGGLVRSEYIDHREELDAMIRAFADGHWNYHRDFLYAIKTIDGKPKFDVYTKTGYAYEQLTAVCLRAGLIRRHAKGFTLTDFGRWEHERYRNSAYGILPLGLLEAQLRPGNLSDVISYMGTRVEDYLGHRLLLAVDASKEQRPDAGYARMLLEDTNTLRSAELHNKNSIIDPRDPFLRTPLFKGIQADLELAGKADLELSPVAYDPQFDHIIFTLRESDGTRRSAEFPRSWYSYLRNRYRDGGFKLLTIEEELHRPNPSGNVLRDGKLAVAVAGHDNHVVGIFQNIIRVSDPDYQLKHIERNLENWYSLDRGDLRNLLG
jgi:hypothetical protein